MEKSKIILFLVAFIFVSVQGAEYVHLIPTDDAFVSSANGSMNYGSAKNLYVGDRSPAGDGQCVSYLKWDLGEIPAGSTITHAEIWLNIHETYPSYQKKTVGAHNVTDTTWSEGGITWDTQPGYNPFATSVVTSTFGTGGYYWNVTADVTGAFDIAAGGGSYSAAMVMVPEEFKWNNFYSKEWVPMPDKRPHLEIMYEPPGRIIPSGLEVYKTVIGNMRFEDGAGLPTIPADFFGPGSDPFDGIITFEPEMPDPLTGTDVVVQREAGFLPEPDQIGPVPVQLVEMNLKSAAPIIVRFPDGEGWIESFFDVYLRPQMPMPGEMFIDGLSMTFGYSHLDMHVMLEFIPHDPQYAPVILNIPGEPPYEEPLFLHQLNQSSWYDTALKPNPPGGLDGFYPLNEQPLDLEMTYGGMAGGSILLEAPSIEPVSPVFLIDSYDEWSGAFSGGGGSGGSIRPMSEEDWSDYIGQMNNEDYLEEGEPYPETEFYPATLYVCGDEGCDHPEVGLVMTWGPSEGDGEYASAWEYVYAVDPDLTNCVIKVTVEPPCGINVVSLGLKDVNGNIRAWYWNVAPVAGPPPAGMIECSPGPGMGATTITVDLSKTGVGAASPAANTYSNNPAFDIRQVMSLSFDENNTFVADVQAPAPGTGIKASWNYWYDLTVTKKVPPADLSGKYYVKWSQRPEVIDDSDPKVIRGWDERSSYHFRPIVADDWLCTDDRPVTDIHWWGSFLGWTQPVPPAVVPRAFHIGIWSDVKAGLDPDVPFSHPGVLIWENFCSSYVWNFFGYDDDPREDWENEACFQFNQLLSEDEWFYQDPNAPWRDESLGGTVYWLSISAIYNATDNVLHPWGWKTRQPHWNDDAVCITDTSYNIDYPPGFPPPTWPPVLGSQWASGYPIEFPIGDSWDVSFELTTIEPSYADNPIPGDVNLDGEVSMPDFVIVASNWLVGAQP